MNSIVTAVQANNPGQLSMLLTSLPPQADLDRAMLLACREGFTECVKCLLNSGGDPNACDASGSPLLYLATKEGHTKVVTLLCEAGAVIDARGVGRSTPLHAAAKWGGDDCMEELLHRGCDVNARDSSASTALVLAIRGRQYMAIRALLDAGCCLDCQDLEGRTALHYASHTAVAVDQLLAAGADPNIRDNHGCTPLLMAATEGLDKVVRSLCHAPGCDVNLANHDALKTPLHILAYKGHLRSVHELLLAGANAHAMDCHCRTPLWYAVVNEKTAVAAELLKFMGFQNAFQCPTSELDDSCPVYQAVKGGKPDFLKLFILSGFDNVHMKTCLTKPEVCTLFMEHKMSHWLELGCEVMSLRQICRTWLRHYTGSSPGKHLHRLPLPVKIVDYLSLKDLDQACMH